MTSEVLMMGNGDEVYVKGRGLTGSEMVMCELS